MAETLEELVLHIKASIPQPKALIDLKPHEKGKFVTYKWNSREFLVKLNMEVMELKSSKLFITGSSRLMQSALLSRNKNEKVLQTVIETLHQSEEMMKSTYKREQGLSLLQSVKKTLERMVPKTKTIT
ncbi:MAG: hypothetical protein K9N62_19355 [Verrucomicrobia bacterium]|nr:hypothetical protein [Verrucomicrobiota bacterium]